MKSRLQMTLNDLIRMYGETPDACIKIVQNDITYNVKSAYTIKYPNGSVQLVLVSEDN